MTGKSHKFAEDGDCHGKENIRAKSLQSVLANGGQVLRILGQGWPEENRSQGQPERARNKKRIGEKWDELK